MNKSLLTHLGEAVDAYRVQRREQKSGESAASPRRPGWRGWLPSKGNVLFTLLLVGLLVIAQSVGALPQSLIPNLQSPPSTGTIAYQGRLADADGNPLTDTVNMIFRLYDAANGGAPLWEEQWTGSNGVQVSDGLFNVMLGSLAPIPPSLITSHSSLFLGITVGTDDEMLPRVQLGSVPFAVQALTVPDGSLTTAKIADGAVTKSKLAPGIGTGVRYQKLPPNWSPLPGSWEDMPGAAITQNFSAGQWKLTLSGALGLTGGNGTIYGRLLVRPQGGQPFDVGMTTLFRSGWNNPSGSSDTQMIILQGLVDLPEGEATIVPQFNSNFASSSMNGTVFIVEQ